MNQIIKLKSRNLAKEVRKNILLLTHKSKSSHIASSFSIVDILSVLYCHILNIKSPKDKNRDIFVLYRWWHQRNQSTWLRAYPFLL